MPEAFLPAAGPAEGDVGAPHRGALDAGAEDVGTAGSTAGADAPADAPGGPVPAAPAVEDVRLPRPPRSPGATPSRSSVAPMEEAWYLTAPKETYRIIVRHFYEQHRAHHYHLSADQVLRHVRGYLPEYREEEVRADLAELVQRRTLDEDLELGLANARTVEDFRRRNSMFALTPLAAELEDLRVRWERHGRQVGELDGGAIGRLEDLVAEVLDALTLPAGHPDRPERVRQRWEDLYSRFEPMSRAANAYIANMRRQEREQLLDLDAFLVYKNTLVHYLTRFIEGLAEVRGTLRQRLRALPADDLAATLAAAASASSKAFEDRAHVRRQYAEQVAALVDWFAANGDADVLQGHASRAIEQVSRAARRLAEARSGAVSRGQELLALAHAFSRCRDVQRADRLAAAAFGLQSPRHWEFMLPEYVSLDPGNRVWTSAPAEIPVQRRRTQTPRQPESAVDAAAAEARREAIREGSRREEAEVAALVERWFGTGPCHVGDLGELTPGERDQLLAWLNDCLVNGGQTRLPTGLALAVTNPGERAHVWLRAADGDVLVPNYRLARVREGAPGGAASA